MAAGVISSNQPIIFFGAPALTAASKTMRAASFVQPFALGCGAKIIPFLVFKEIRALKIAVDVGFVVGTIPAITPTGSAIFVNPCSYLRFGAKKIIKTFSSKPLDFSKKVWYYIYLYGRTRKAHPLRCRGK